MAALPQIGSTLSLISNADIRYEGELFTVNPKECTIALCNVRSYGTEDRVTSVRVEPHPNTYDYILFRGSDIKDIKIVGPPRRTIVSAASVSTVVDSQSAKPAKATSSSNESDAANSIATAVPTNVEKSSTRTTSSEDEVLSPIRKNNSADLVDDSLKQQYIAGGSSFSSKKDNRTNSTSTVLNLSAADTVKRQDIVITAQPSSVSKQQSDSVVIRSTSSTSQSNSFKNHENVKPKRNVADNVRSSAVQRPYQQTSFHQDGGGGYQQKELKLPQQNYNDGGINKSLGKTTGQPGRYHRGNHFYGSRGAPASRYEDQINNGNRYYGGNVRNNEMFNRYRDNMESNWHYGGAVSNATARTNWGDRNYSLRNNGRMDGGSPGRFYNQPTMIYRSNARSDFRSTNNNANNRKIMEFNSDYDFEQANMKFEELKSQLSKVKISSDGELTDDASNKDDSSSLNANADESTENSVKNTFYDKSKSFFDHISCETLEKSKGTPTRTNWRNERKLNSETFGTIAVRGGYRGGRGGYIQNRAANMRGATRSAGHYYGYGRY